jgi:hypothetical protein
MLELVFRIAAQTNREMVEDIQPQRPTQQSLEKNRATEDFLRARAAAVEPTQKSLDTMIERARAFRIIKGGVSGDRPMGTEILLEGRDEKMLADLRHFLQIAGAENPCFCSGDPCIEFLDESGNRLAAISIQHRTHIRWSAWGLDANLVDGFGLMKWLVANGVTDPCRERAKKVARAVLDGQIAVPEGVGELRHLADPTAIDDEKDRTLIIAFAIEIPFIPIGDVRKLWAPYALEMKDEELARAEARWQKGFLEVCKRIAES